MNFLRAAPFFRFLIPFLIGILLEIYVPFSNNYYLILLTALTILLLVLSKLKQFYSNYRIRWLFGATTYLSLFLSGSVITYLNTEINHKNHYSNFYKSSEIFVAKVIEPPIKKSKSYKLTVEISQISSSISDSKPCRGKLLCYMEADSMAEKLEYGDIIYFKNSISEIPSASNPHEFDYKNYLRFHQIYFQTYLKSNQWHLIKKGSAFSLFMWANRVRNSLLNTLHKYNIEGDEFAVASALILGYKNELDQELVQAYSSAGAMHVLAVSGLHVGIIFWIFELLLKPISRFKWGKWITPFLLLLLLWGYALLTGLSPSVMRASTMFSFVIVGKILDRNTNIFNTLAVSAFFLLLTNPYLIMEVGFQLSYLAVFGIIYIQPRLYSLWYSNYSWAGKIGNWLIDKIWVLTSVSIAAQIATFPLGLLYFHQFPNYFLVSNIIVIPLATLIIYIGILLFVISPISPLALITSSLFKWLIFNLNLIIIKFEKLPYSLLNEIAISVTETWIIYLVILLTLSYFASHRITHLKAALTLIILLCIYQLNETVSQKKQKKITIYNIKNTTAIEFTDGKKSYFFADSSLLNNESKLLYHVKHNWWENGIAQVETYPLNKLYEGDFEKNNIYIKNGIGQFYDKRFLIPNKRYRKIKPIAPIQTDLLIISHNSLINAELINKLFSYKNLIIDASNSTFITNRIKDYFKENKHTTTSIISMEAFETRF